MDTTLKGNADTQTPLAVEVQVLVNGVPVTWQRDPNHVPPPGISVDNVADILAGLRAMQMLHRQYSGVYAGKGDISITQWDKLPYSAAIHKAIEAAGLHHEQPLQPTAPSIATSAAAYGAGALQVVRIKPAATLDTIRAVRQAHFYQTTDGPQVWFEHEGTVYRADVVGNNTATLAHSQQVYFVAKHQQHGLIELSVEPVQQGWQHVAAPIPAPPTPPEPGTT